jgi:hypothetical protein
MGDAFCSQDIPCGVCANAMLVDACDRIKAMEGEIGLLLGVMAFAEETLVDLGASGDPRGAEAMRRIRESYSRLTMSRLKRQEGEQ